MRSRHARALTAVLALQAAMFYSASRGERVPLRAPLREFPAEVREWRLVQETAIEPEIRDVLRADDVMSRVYAGTRAPANLFIAYFQSQRTGQRPHSPQNCLPGHGWLPSAAGTIAVSVPGEPQPLEINRFVVSRGSERSVVLYWYQSRERVIAGEYAARFWLVADSIRYSRSDTALVRVVVPVEGGDEAAATDAATSFVQSFFPVLKRFLPA
jgi:EpsI family protein